MLVFCSGRSDRRAWRSSFAKSNILRLTIFGFSCRLVAAYRPHSCIFCLIAIADRLQSARASASCKAANFVFCAWRRRDFCIYFALVSRCSSLTCAQSARNWLLTVESAVDDSALLARVFVFVLRIRNYADDARFLNRNTFRDVESAKTSDATNMRAEKLRSAPVSLEVAATKTRARMLAVDVAASRTARAIFERRLELVRREARRSPRHRPPEKKKRSNARVWSRGPTAAASALLVARRPHSVGTGGERLSLPLITASSRRS